jgi:uncharacterized protein YaiL (DUF2058 family)
MPGSLSDQLLKAGLVSSGKAKKARHDKKRQRKSGDSASSATATDQLREEKAQRDRQLNQQRDREQRQRALLAEVEQLIASHALKPAAGEEGLEGFHFTDGSTIHRLDVDKLTADGLGIGRMAIVRSARGYRVVKRDIAERISERLPEVVVMLNQDTTSEQPDAEDPYADFVVPDDLRW